MVRRRWAVAVTRHIPTASEAISRTVLKTACYRLLMVLITVLVALGITGNTGDALQIGVAANVVKTGTYYGYERLWARISWGTDAV